MPKVPVVKENVRMRPQNPTGFASASQGRRAGEALAGVGDGLLNVSKGLAAMERSKRTLAGDAVNNRVQEGYQNLIYEANKQGLEGDRLVEYFDKNAPKVEKQAIDATRSEFGDYDELYEVTTGKVRVGFRGNVIKSSIESTKKFLEEKITQNNASLEMLAYKDPSQVDLYSTKSTQTNTKIMNDLGVTDPNLLQRADRTARAKILESGIRGFMDKGQFDNARKTLVKYPALFSTEERESLFKEISSTETSFKNEQFKIQEREKKQQEELLKKEQSARLSTLRAQLLDARDKEDLALTNSLRIKFENMIKEQEVAAKDYTGLLTEFSKNYQVIDSSSSLSISKKVFDAETSSDYDKAERYVEKLEKTGHILDKTAERWLKTIDQLRNKKASNKTANLEYKSAYLKLQAQIGYNEASLEQRLAVQFDDVEATKKLQRLYEAKADLTAAQAEGIPAETALQAILPKYFKGTSQLTPYEGSGIIPKTLEDVERLQAWAEGHIKTPAEKREFYKYLTNAVDVISQAKKANARIEEAEEIRKIDPMEATKLLNMIDSSPFRFEVDEKTFIPMRPGELPPALQAE